MKKLSRSEAGKLGAEKSLEICKKLFLLRIENYNLNPKFCKNCNNSIPYAKRDNNFCNHSCSAVFNNKKRIKRKKYNKMCPHCQKVLSKQNIKFCSNECKFNFKVKNNIIEGYPAAIRRFLMKTRKYECEICKLNTWLEKPITLQTDHINGNSYDNSLNNLRLLCPNCHSQTPTFGAKNLGNGRHARRLRYKMGKSS